MLSFGENGWIKYGWTEQLNRERNPKDHFYIKFSPQPKKNTNNSVFDIAISCIEKISQTYPPPYNLMCSGGTDSQAVCYAWLKSGIPFNVISVKYVSDGIWWNQHDLVTLEKFSDVNKLKVDYKEFDIIHFLENDLTQVALTYECSSPQISTHIKMTDLVPSGTIIFSGNFIMQKKMSLTYALLGMHKYSLYKKRKDVSIIPFFFLEYPELAYAFDKDGNGYSEIKHNLYNKYGFNVIQQDKKITGFEELKNFYDKYHKRVKAIDRVKFSNKPSKRVFDLLFRYPYEGWENHLEYQLITKE